MQMRLHALAHVVEVAGLQPFEHFRIAGGRQRMVGAAHYRQELRDALWMEGGGDNIVIQFEFTFIVIAALCGDLLEWKCVEYIGRIQPWIGVHDRFAASHLHTI